MTRAIDVVRQVAPKGAKASYLAAFESGDSLLQQHDITTPNRLAHFLSQVLHESGGLTLEHESMKYQAARLVEIFGVGHHSAAITSEEAERLAGNERGIAERVYGIGNRRKSVELGNTGPGDGFRYRGCGLMQTTGRSNYRRIGQLCGVDFEQNPDLVFSAEHALKPALAEWSEGGLNVYADNNDILAISRAINCGSPKSKKIPNGMKDRTTWFAKVRRLIDRVDFKAGTVLATEPRPPRATSASPPSELLGQSIIADLVGERILREDDEGPVVRAVQLALARLGYHLKGTGFFGGATERAVRDFQTRQDLEVDGEVGPESAKAIDRALASLAQAGQPSAQGGASSAAPGGETLSSTTPPTVARSIADLVGDRFFGLGDQGAAVHALQLALAEIGYGLKDTSYYSGATESAVADFQQQQGLEVDGEVDAETARAIDCALAERRSGLSASALADLIRDRILRMGDLGPIVRAVLLGLARLGYQLKWNGDFVLKADGETGPEITKAIDRALAALVQPAAPSGLASKTLTQSAAAESVTDLVGASILRLGNQGPAVRAVQFALAKFGYRVEATGNFDDATKASVTDFQQQRGLEVDGEVGAETARAIDQALTGASPHTAQGDLVPPTPGPGARPLWLIEGLKWVGTREVPGGADNPEIVDWAEQEGGTIADVYKDDSIPWCALFANMVLTKVGIKGTETLWALDWNNWGLKLAGPAEGAFAPMKRDGGGHIAIVVGRDKRGNLMCLGGNQSDAVNIKPFQPKRPLSFRWPAGVPLPRETGFDSLPLMSSDGPVSTKES